MPTNIAVRLPSRTDTLHVRGWRASTGPNVTNAPTFVVIHGVGLSHRPYGRLAHELAKSRHVIGVDMPGFGGVQRPLNAVSVEELAQAVAALLDAMAVSDYVVVGHSMGVQVALELALIDRARAKAVVFIGPVVNPKRRTLAQQALALARDSAKEPPATNLLILRDYLTCGLRWYLAETLEMLKYSTELRIEGLKIPLLVIRGADDPIAPQGWCDWLAATSSTANTVSIPGHRHVVAHTRGDEVARHIAHFCTGTACL